MGGGTLGEAFRQLASDPASWAYVAAATLCALGRPLTPTLHALTAPLARAHAPLALLALGLTLDVTRPPIRQVRARVRVGCRLACTLHPCHCLHPAHTRENERARPSD